MSRKVQIVLGTTGNDNLEITPEPIADHSKELITKHEIVGVFPTYNVKPNNADVYYSSATTPPEIGMIVTGLTSGATGIVVGYIGTVGLKLSNVVGEFATGETLNFNIGYSGAGTSAGVGSWAGVSGATSGSGTGISFNVQTTAGVVYDVINIVNPGSGYLIGDTITILGTSLGGATPANDLVITITGDSATVDEVQPQSFDNEWIYPYPVMTIVSVVTSNNVRFDFELQDVTNQAGWSTGTKAGLDQCIADFNAWL